MRKTFSFYILLVLVSIFHIHAQKNEIGFFPITNFTPNEIGALPQNWAITQDNRGIIYAGNREGLLEFDGSTWRKIKTPGEDDVRSVAMDENGRIYIGGVSEFGYISTNIAGKLNYTSLLYLLKDEDKNFYDVWKTFYVEGKVFYQTNNKIFCYCDDTIKVWNAETEFHNSFLAANEFFVSQKEIGLMLLKKNLYLPENGNFFKDKKIYILLPFQDSTSFLAITNEHGSYVISLLDNQKLNIKKYISDSEEFIKEHQIYHGIYIDKKTISIGTFDGIEMISRDGKLEYWLNKQMGLSDENIKYQYIDNLGNLWLALQNGISRVEINSPITLFDERSNIQGNIESITRFNGKIYIATSAGAYYLENHDILTRQFSAFKPIYHINNETWIVRKIDLGNVSSLFIEANDDIYEVKKNENKGISILKNIPWAIHQSKINPNIVYIGVENGLMTLIYKNNRWVEGSTIKGIKERVTNITEDNSGILWLATGSEKGFYRLIPKNKENLQNSNYTIKFFDFAKNGNEAAFSSLNYNNKIIFGTSMGFFELNPKTDSFIIEQNLDQAFEGAKHYIHRASVDPDGKLWASIYISKIEKDEIGYFKFNNDSTLVWYPTPFEANVKGQINAIYHDGNGITWLGGNEGLYRYDENMIKDYTKQYFSLIRKVKLGQDSTIFYGTYYNENGNVSITQPDELKYILPYKHNSLIFEYSAQNIDIGYPTLYSYYLDGYDKKWSDWTEETKKEYTNLSEGKYVFRVKAKNVYGNISQEANYEFSIEPPWYRTILAYIGYVLGLVGFIYLIVTQYTKYLRQIIKENTAEIRAQKEEIEEQKEEITDSIKYAQRIQKAICPSPERAEELLPEHFVLWRPRDIVSGDYWWMTEKNGQVAIVAADCTGHGVPGAFMSMLGVSFLNEIVNKMDDLKANEILNQLRASVKKTLKQTGKEGEQKDGMDLALVILDVPSMKIQYAGAYNPLYLYRNGELIEIKADKNPIGIFIKELDSFTNHDIEVQKGDTFYIFSDGYVDQFGGEKGGKFKTKKFKELLADIQKLTMKDQKEILNQTIDNWRGEIDQVDDIIVVGIRM